MSQPTQFETLRNIYKRQGAYDNSSLFEKAIPQVYEEDINELAPYLNLNLNMTTSTNASSVFSFLAEKAHTDPAAMTLLKRALRVNACRNQIDARTIEEQMANNQHFIATMMITHIHSTCVLSGATHRPALENSPHAPLAALELPSSQIASPAIRLADTALGQSRGEQEEREEQILFRADYCDALRLLVKSCLELGLHKEVDDAVAIATRLKKPAFVAIAQLCKKEADPTNVPGATDNHAWTRLRDRLSGKAIEAEVEVG